MDDPRTDLNLDVTEAWRERLLDGAEPLTAADAVARVRQTATSLESAAWAAEEAGDGDALLAALDRLLSTARTAAGLVWAIESVHDSRQAGSGLTEAWQDWKRTSYHDAFTLPLIVLALERMQEHEAPVAGVNNDPRYLWCVSAAQQVSERMLEWVERREGRRR